jgi:nucleotide-binding universal stress UspA family protein
MNEKIERILVTTDGSAEAEHAFAAMMPIVRMDHPEVSVLYVLEDPEASFYPPAKVAKACGALRVAGVDAHLVIREGSPAEEIVRLSKKSDLLVMSTHGRGGFKRILLGSVTEAVVRGAELPMLVTRPGVAVREWTRMIVALDGSPNGERILNDVIPLARRLHSAVELVRAAWPPITGGGLGDTPGVQIYEDPLPYLEGMKSWLATQGVDASVKALEGRAGAQILRIAEESDSPLLCMTTHGRTGLSRVLLGSIADEVIRHAPCPVLLRRSVPYAATETPASPEELAHNRT